MFTPSTLAGWPVYRPGAPTPFVSGLEALAEDGNVRPMQPYLERHPDVAESGIFYKPVGSDTDAELWPGVVFEFRLSADPGEKLSFATMLMQSNDIVYGPRDGRMDLFDADGQPISGDISRALGISSTPAPRSMRTQSPAPMSASIKPASTPEFRSSSARARAG